MGDTEESHEAVVAEYEAARKKAERRADKGWGFGASEKQDEKARGL